MMLSDQHTDVLIIGAGPSGLMMVAQLLRCGVRAVIIDSKKGPTDKTKALAVQARSMEIYRQMGIVDEVLKGGRPSRGLRFFFDGNEQGTFPITDSGAGLTPYPYLFMYPQSRNEKDMLNYLTQNALPVYWNTTLTELQQDSAKVITKLTNGESVITVTADWVVGADGAHSFVRKSLGSSFKGDTYQHKFYLADVVSDKSDDTVSLYFNNRSFAAFFPSPDKDSYRIIGALPKELEDKPDIRLEDLTPVIEKIKGSPTVVKRNNWFTIYKLSHRMADKFQEGRCFLIGDAAHIHSPVGGQGMNTGLQDAYNLAWKLGGVINGSLMRVILSSYAAERMPVAKTLLKTTDRLFNITMSTSWGAQLFKRFLMPPLLKTLWSFSGFTKALFMRVSQIGISYRDSKINLHLSQATHIKAGDRLPYLKIYDEKKQIETDLHAWCTKAGFTMIVMGTIGEQELHRYAKWITQSFGAVLNFFYLPYSTRNDGVFNAFEIKAGHIKTLIIRPDNYIGLIADSADLGIVNNYLINTALINSKSTV
ncbi:FAD-dependent monooxygenase [Mucilaginibacter ginkgonis]|uniref:FAD-dependent monooxygenase n=1 Tax=Mucilaginibacter ginkgonis TaxID=2682091 RepID=A0A6I4HYB1_9SPHI|nr:FAD-dependent monooxygenase [Mucilaginibacter ginkgonis]QQL49454.1 FAD-dependent monooxygenase [Mucilaginibacter ginkgonis]